MFKIILNAIELVISRDARESTSILLDLFKKSPEWKNDICTINADISYEYKERSLFLSHVVEIKLKNLKYNKKSIDNYVYVFRELVNNAFEYGYKGKKPIKIIIDISSSYVSSSIFNSKGKNFNFKGVVDNKNIISDSIRGRGVLISKIKSDEVMHIENKGIKYIIYRDLIDIECKIIDNMELLLIVHSGLNNPALGDKLIEKIKEGKNTIDYNPMQHDIVIFLDKDIYLSKEKERTEREDALLGDTHTATRIIEFINKEDIKNIKVIHSDYDLQKLLPAHIFSTTYK